jgi:hypothetical protein
MAEVTYSEMDERLFACTETYTQGRRDPEFIVAFNTIVEMQAAITTCPASRS